MVHKKHIFLTLPLLVSAVSFTAITQSSAALYKAKTDWSVHTEDGADYCSASQGFSDKAYVTFAKRNDRSMSLAVDFQKKTFETQKKYAFKVKSGAISRSFNIQPSSENAIVFPLGDDAQLISELKKTSILSVDIGGEAYDFSLRNPANLEQKLATCIADVAPAQRQIVSQPSSESQGGTQGTEVEKLKAENIRLSSLLKELRRESDAKIASFTASPRIEEAKERAFVLEQENSKLKSELSSLSQLSANLENINTLKSNLEQLATEKADLQQKLASANSQILELSATETENNEQAKTAESLSLQLEEKKTEINALAQEKMTLVSQLQDVQSKLDSISQGAEEKSDALSVVKEKHQMALEEKSLKISSIEAELTSAQGSIQQLETEKLELLNQLANKGSKVSDAAKMKEELESFQLTIAEKQAEIDRLIAENTELLSQVDQATATEENEVDVSGIENDLREELADQSALLASLQEQNIALEEEISKYKEFQKDQVLQTEDVRLTERRYKTALVDLEAIKAENISLEDQIDILENQILELKTSQKKIALAPDASWDLEKATQRYQEAQREIVSLGRLVEQKEAQCNLEKQDIEGLLFDPEIAEREQRMKLSALQSELDEKDEIISQLEAQITSAPAKVRPVAVALKEPVSGEPLVQKIELPEQSLPQKTETKKVEVIEKTAMQTQSSTDYIRTLLSTADVSGDIQQQDKGDMTVLRWKKGGLHGTAVGKPLVGESLSQAVNSYIDRAQSKCSGDFAAVPSLQSDQKQTYEIACVKPGGKGSSASLLFLANNNNMITIAHEGRTDLMADAIEARDQLSKVAHN